MKKCFLILLINLCLVGYTYSSNFIEFRRVNSVNRGLINSCGKEILPCEFFKIQFYSYDLLITRTDTNRLVNDNSVTRCLHDTTGKVLVNHIADIAPFNSLITDVLFIKEFSNSGNGNWALYSRDGQAVTGFIFTGIGNNQNTSAFASVKKGNTYMLINQEGKVIYQCLNKKVFGQQSKRFTSKSIIRFSPPRIFGDGEDNEDRYVFFQDENTLKKGVKYFGKIIISAKYDTVVSSVGNIFLVGLNGKFGLVDDNDEVIVDIAYDRICDFNSALAIVEQKSQYAIFDCQTRKALTAFNYDYLRFFTED